MLRTNLSTRPFYNLRAVRLVLGTVLVVVIGLTVFNAAQLVSLVASYRTLGARAVEAEEEADRLRADAARLRSQINPTELQVVARAAREANALIDQRAFSWTDLLAQFEATLPPDVRITAVQPRLERDRSFVVSIGVESRRAEDLDAFIEALETQGGFHNVLSVKEQTNMDGLIQAVVEGTYIPPPTAAEADGGT